MVCHVVIDRECPYDFENQEKLPNHGDYLTNCLATICSTPLASLATFFKEFLSLDGPCLIMSPVKIESGHNDSVISEEYSQHTIDKDYLSDIFHACKEFLVADGLCLHWINGHYWLLEGSRETPLCQAKPVQAMKHLSLFPEMQRLDEKSYWARLLTELQMLCNSHPATFNRQLQNLSIINGVWLWGQAAMDLSKPVIHAISDDPSWLDFHKNSNCLIKSWEFDTHNGKISHVFLKDCDDEKLLQLELFNKKSDVIWHWNDISYCIKKQPWWQRCRGLKRKYKCT